MKDRKNILVTAGPIPAYIDPIKIVTNKFKGGLAIKTAKEIQKAGHNVTLLMWEGTPIDTPNMSIITCHDVFDYYNKMKASAHIFDAIICAAAVANLVPKNPLDHKFPSHNFKVGDNIPIEFTIAPRAIDAIKKENPRCTLIGYKCLDAPKDELVRAAKITLADSHADIIFANTPTEAKTKKTAIYSDDAAIEMTFEEHIKAIIDAIETIHYKTIIQTPQLSTKDEESLVHTKNIVRLYESTFEKHGSVAVPFPTENHPHAFVTTSRGHRTNPVLVLDIDHDKHVIYATDKATLNAPSMHTAIENSL